MREVKITVSAADIENGVPMDSLSDPRALAILGALPKSVTGDDLFQVVIEPGNEEESQFLCWIMPPGARDTGETEIAILPGEDVRRTNDWDAGEGMEPHETTWSFWNARTEADAFLKALAAAGITPPAGIETEEEEDDAGSDPARGSDSHEERADDPAAV